MYGNTVENYLPICLVSPFSNDRALARKFTYEIVDDPNAYHILIELNHSSTSSLSCSLDFAKREAAFIVKSTHDERSSQTTFIFRIPQDADINEFRLLSRRRVHIVSINKYPARLELDSAQAIYM